MHARPLPRPLPRGLRWVVPVGVFATVVTGGVVSTLVVPVPGPAPAPIALGSVSFAVLLATLGGAILLVPSAPTAAAWLSVGSGLALVPHDLPSWVLLGVTLGAFGAFGLHLRAAVSRRALETWARRAVAAPPPDVAAQLAVSPWRDPFVILLSAVGTVLVVGGLLWTAADVRAVTQFRSEAIESTGRVTSVDDDGFSATIAVEGATVVAPVNLRAPEVGAPVAVRWAPRTGRAEVMGDDFDPSGPIVWSGLGVVLHVAAWRRRRRIGVLRHAGAAPALATVVMLARVQTDQIAITDARGRYVGSLVDLTVLGEPGGAGRTEAPATEVPAPWEDVLRDERAVDELTDAEVVARNRALAAVLSAASDDGDAAVALHEILPPASALDLIVLDDALLDRPVLARAGDVWLTATLTGPMQAEERTAPPDDSPTTPLDAVLTPPVVAADEPSPFGGSARVRDLLGRSDGLLLIPVHLIAAGITWSLLREPADSLFNLPQILLLDAWLIATSHRHRALVRVHPRYLESRGIVWDPWIPWSAVEHVGRSDGAVVIRHRRAGEQRALVLERPVGASWSLVSRATDDEVARRRIEQAWAAGQGAPRPLLPGRPSFSAVLGLGWLALLLTVLLR